MLKLKTRLLIKHNGSGHNLSIEPDFPVPTCFGNELEVSVDSKYDQRRRISFENIWYFDTDRSLPKPTDPCEKAFVEQAKFDAKINANDIHHSAIESAKEEAAAREVDWIFDFFIIKNMIFLNILHAVMCMMLREATEATKIRKNNRTIKVDP
jgi:hypothetical protein